MVGLKSGSHSLVVAFEGARESLFLCPAVAHGRGRRTSNTTPLMGDLVAGRQSQDFNYEQVVCHPVAWFELSPELPRGTVSEGRGGLGGSDLSPGPQFVNLSARTELYILR